MAYSGGAVMGLAVGSLGLAGLGAVLLIFRPESVGFRTFGEIVYGQCQAGEGLQMSLLHHRNDQSVFQCYRDTDIH